jgi:ankyrin repeat protein
MLASPAAYSGKAMVPVARPGRRHSGNRALSDQISQSVRVTEVSPQLEASDDAALLTLFGLIASHDHIESNRRLDAAPDLVTRSIRAGATRNDPDTYFLAAIHHYVYAGDTALHIAAAAYKRELVGSLLEWGADVHARNRRGAQPLHYAADGSPNAGSSIRAAQSEVITLLIEAGSHADAMDKSGVAPLHRAVRTRSSDAVKALLAQGADPRLLTKSGSTPLHLAVQNTGKSNSGSDAAKNEQRRIIEILLEHGASPTDVNAKGRSVADAASSDWVRRLLSGR